MSLLNELHNRRERLATLCGELRGAAERADYDDVYRLAFEVATLGDSIVEKTERIGAEPKMSQAMALMTSQQSDEWYTPAWVIELVRQVLGGIDLDPASCAVAQQTVQAARFYTQAEDGYSRPWSGRVWLNPPFTEAERWARRLAAAYTDGDVSAGILLINSAPGYNWYEALVDAWPAVQLRKRLAFTRADGSTAGLAKKSQTLVYFGTEVARFEAALAPYGRRLHGSGAALVAPLFEEVRDVA